MKKKKKNEKIKRRKKEVNSPACLQRNVKRCKTAQSHFPRRSSILAVSLLVPSSPVKISTRDISEFPLLYEYKKQEDRIKRDRIGLDKTLGRVSRRKSRLLFRSTRLLSVTRDVTDAYLVNNTVTYNTVHRQYDTVCYTLVVLHSFSPPPPPSFSTFSSFFSAV